MKKIKIIAAVLVTALFLAGCNNSGTNSSAPVVGDYEFTSNITEDFTFTNIDVDETKETINAFSVMDDNKTALLIAENNSSDENVFAVYENGKEIGRTAVSSSYREICYNAGEKCFYSYNTESRELHIMDEGFGFKGVLASGLEAFEIKNMDVVDNRLYLIAVTKGIMSDDIIFDPKEGYADFGEKVYTVDLSTGELKDIELANVICQSYSNDALFYYACRDGQYSLNVFDREANALKTVKNIDNIGYIYSFAVIGDEMIYLSAEDSRLSKLNLNSGKDTTEAERVLILRNSDFEVYKNSLIYLNRTDMSIVRCGKNGGTATADEKLAQFNGEELVIANHGGLSVFPIDRADLASETGISATVYELPMYDEEIKLKLLAGDSDVDIFIFSSARRTGIDIRRMGCYVPLTDEAILNKREQYFDWIKDYTVSDNGEVWCVPIYASTYATFYVPDNLKALGIEPEELASFDGYFSALEKVKAQDRYKFYGSTLDFADVMNESYNVNHSYFDYDNELYRNMFERIYSGWLIRSNPVEGTDEHPLFNNIAGSEERHDKIKSDNMAFMINSSELFLNKLENPNDWRAMPLLALSSSDGKNPATVEYAIINPFSKKKEAAEAYLGYITENNLEYIKSKSFIFKDRSLYGDYAGATASCFDGLYELFENGAVYELVISIAPGFRRDEIAYQNGEMTLDEYIANLERVSEMSASE